MKEESNISRTWNSSEVGFEKLKENAVSNLVEHILLFLTNCGNVKRNKKTIRWDRRNKSYERRQKILSGAVLMWFHKRKK